jgi:hypothetical protein
MKLLVEIPATYPAERDYILTVLLQDILGLQFDVRRTEQRGVRISGNDGRVLVLPDGLFATPQERWLHPMSLPQQPLETWDVREQGLDCPLVSPLVPVIYGKLPNESDPLTPFPPGVLAIPIDIFGSCFAMLTRYEEVVKHDRDQRDRFPVTASLPYQEGFLERPIVNEYIEILWAYLSRLWPGMKRKPRQYRVLLTHDVDSPLCSLNWRWPDFLRAGLGDVVKRRSISLAGQRLRAHCGASPNRYDADPYNTFDFIMGISERYGLKSAFYFIGGVIPEVVNSHYDLAHPWIKQLISRIHQRGHEVGLHPGYGTYRDFRHIQAEYEKFVNICSELGVRQDGFGGRQHGLQWTNPTTWRNWDRLGLTYDSTVGFAERPGFRCGICYEYPVFDLVEHKRMNLLERPLITMDTSLFTYLKCDIRNASDYINKLSINCRLFHGDFVGLWHNNKLISNSQKHWYQDVISSIV